MVREKRHARKWEQPEQMNRGEKWCVVVLATSRMELLKTRVEGKSGRR